MNNQNPRDQGIDSNPLFGPALMLALLLLAVFGGAYLFHY